MSIAARVGRVERDHFAETCRWFRLWFLDLLRDPVLGAPADGTPTEIAAWFDAQPRPPWDAAVEGAIHLLMERPDDQAAIRTALAHAAPHLGYWAHNPPLTLLAALRAAVTE